MQPSADATRHVAPGFADFDLPLGPARVGIRGLPASFEEFVAPRYGAFAEPPNPLRPPTFAMQFHAGDGVVVPLPPPGGETVLELDALGAGRFALRSHWHRGLVDLASASADITLTERRTDRFEMSFENALRVAAQLHLIDRGAFLFHAAAVIDRGRVHLFFGPSGAGKSTAMRYSAPRVALSDDMIVIDTDGDGVFATTVPFHMKMPPADRVRGRHPVAAGFRLRQSPDDRLERLSPARATATLAASVPYVHELGVPHEGLTALVARAASRFPICELYFTKSARFWDVIAEGVAD